MRWLRRLWYLLNHRALERELEREMVAHRAMMGDARRFGSTLRLREESADVWGWTWLERLGQDVRYAARLLRRRPVLSATAILTLMLGIGGTTAVFSLVDALRLRNLPVADPEALVRMVERAPDGTRVEAFTLLTHDRLQRGSKTLSGVIASASAIGRAGEIEVGGERRNTFLQLVSDNYFDVLGVRAARGRLFHPPPPGDPGESIAIISDDYWRRQYGADPSVVGTRFRRGAREFTIAGIAPPGFRGTEIDVPIDIWVPIDQVVAPDAEERIRGRWMRVMGRLRPGVTPAQAGAEAAAILERPVRLEPGGIGYSTLRGRLHEPLLLVSVVVALVLLIACANLANLMLAATISREREVAVRAAIGASRGRILRLLMTESALLALLGAALGLGVASWTSGALLAFLPPEQAIALPNLRFELSAHVLGFVAVVSIGACLLIGALPALRVSGKTGAGALKGGASMDRRNRSAVSRGLLVVQVVMCTALLIVAGVFVRTVQNLRGQDAGYREDRLVVADVGFPRPYPEERRDQLIEALRARAATLPGVEIAAFSHIGQLSGSAIQWDIAFPGRNLPAGVGTDVMEQRVSPDFLAAMGTPLIAGRDFVPADDERAPLVAIVNESFVRRFLPADNPIGARFFLEGGSRSGELLAIVGVAKDAKWIDLRNESSAMYYRPYRQMGGTPTVRLVVRTAGDPEAVSRELPRVAQAVDPQMVLNNVVPFGEIVNRTLVVERLVAHVSTAFGALALLIAGIGLYGVLAYSVVRRRREIGLRVAVGAHPGTIERMFLRESLTLVACGAAIGIPVAIVTTRLVASLLFGLSPQDPTSIAVAVTALTMTTLAAAYLPAHRAARVQPIEALRQD
jgi:putative ABC transport system permease protein